MDECKELAPAFLRFIKGVVDAQDLSLNVSREILQQDRQIRAIRKQIVKKVFDTLMGIRKDDSDKFQKFWAQFGPVLKEGLVSNEQKDRDRVLELMLVNSTHGDNTTLAEYVERMKEDQEDIYYLTGPSIDAVKNSPHLEAFKAKGYEVLFFTDGIDEIWVERGYEFKEKSFKSVGKGEIDLNQDEDDSSKENREEKEKELKDLLTQLRSHLQEDIKEVRLSSRLTESAVCLVSDSGDMTPQMEKLMAQMGQEVPKTRRILELNPDHAIVKKLKAMHEGEEGKDLLKDYADLLYGQAILAEAGQLPDPARFSKLIAQLMVQAS